eukprot:278697_1
MGKPSGIKGDKNYDQDYDVNHKYHDEWKGLTYSLDEEIKMKKVMDTTMPAQAQVFATKKTYLYYTQYYAMLEKMNELRRANVLASINKRIEDPLKYKARFVSGSKSFGVVNTTLGVGAIAGLIYALRFIKG